ncbi:MAG: MG2 domain-containing protein [Myxococcota bacterium]
MRWSTSLVLCLAASCVLPHTGTSVAGPGTDAFERAPSASPRLDLATVPAAEDIATRIDSYFDSWGSHRMHVQLDRPLYRPGDAVWVKSWTLKTSSMDVASAGYVTYELVNPRGQVVQTKSVAQSSGGATNDFILGADAPGGKWTLRARFGQELDERSFIVSNVQAPSIRKKMEFVREAYGAGDTLEALVELERGAGGPLADHEVKVLLQVDGRTVFEGPATTSKDGAVLVSATLPSVLETGDGLLTVLVEDGGITESISRSVPIVLADAKLAFFPEGGDLVQGLPGRVYLQSTNRHGEPADVEGYVTDDRGRRVSTFRTEHDGLGRFKFTPEAGRSYAAHITSPAGIDGAFALPAAAEEGCTLRSFDDINSQDKRIRVGVRCTTDQPIVVTGVLREQTIDAAAVKARAGKEAVVYLSPSESLSDQQGALRVTAFNSDLQPMAERLVYRNHGKSLNINITTDQLTYGPRDEVIVDVTTTDPSGDPVAANLALSVVDDKVIAFADDKNGHMLTRLYLEPELVDSPKDPAFYFDPDEALASRAMDLVMGTKGYRRFEWAPVWNQPARIKDLGSRAYPTAVEATRIALDDVTEDEAVAERVEKRPRPGMFRKDKNMVAVPKPAPLPPVEELAGGEIAAGGLMGFDVDGDLAKRGVEEKEHRRGMVRIPRGRAMARAQMADRIAFEDADALDMNEFHGQNAAVPAPHAAHMMSPVRVFPKPDYQNGLSGTRSDFRDTVHWEPSVRTGSKGTAQVRFYLSDAITTFRITAEGVGGGFAGHSEQTLNSVLPVSVATMLPPAVSVGDRLIVPVTVTSTRSSAMSVDVAASFDSGLLTVANGAAMQQKMKLGSEQSETLWVPVDIGSGREMATIRMSAEGDGTSDSAIRQLQIVPPGFPQAWSVAGEGEGTQKFVVELNEVVPDSLVASVTWHPSSMSTLMTGMEGMIRTPGGCFEQTSSTNWPNVAILKYLEAHDGDPRLKVQSKQALDAGYNKLTGYQIKAGGFETWGTGPGKEALSAFGLLQFKDMAEVYDVDKSGLDNEVTHLLAQRDGRGGFQKTGESAHGYGAAPEDVLNGFITYSLVETGHGNRLQAELRKQASIAESSSDPYVLALATRSLLKAGHSAGPRAAKRLAALQADDGSFPGAQSSITRSYEANLLVESTALAALALMKANDRTASSKAADWLVEHRQGPGTWGATQATALALGALTEHAEMNKRPKTDGEVALKVNGKRVGTLTYDADEQGSLVLDGWQEHLRAGRNTIELTQLSGEPLPYSVDVNWMSTLPATSPGAELGLHTELSSNQVGMGNTVRMTAAIDNKLERVVPSPIARIGLPAGLQAQAWQLEQLQERGEIAFFETRDREVTLYWDGIKPNQVHEVKLDLVATVPGVFTAPASSAYPYYNDDEKAWSAGSKVTIAVP